MNEELQITISLFELCKYNIVDYVELLLVKMSSKPVIPTRATEHSVGLDFYSPSDYIMPPCSQLQVPTQIRVKIPLGHYGRLTSKSGLSMIHQVHVGAGVIDPDYTGEIKVLLIPLYQKGRPYSPISFGKGIITNFKKSG